MSVWQWIAIVLICCAAVAFATGLITEDITLRKEEKKREERERELKIEEELRVIVAEEIADDIARNVFEQTKKACPYSDTCPDFMYDHNEEIEPKTILGYDARELLIFAQMCKKQGITETELKHCVENFEFAFRVADRCVEESLENVLKKFYFNPKDL